MGIYDIYYKRKQHQENAGKPDVYKYDEIPESLRIQVSYIWESAIGTLITGHYNFDDEYPNDAWIAIHDILCREFGVLSLGEERNHKFERCRSFLFSEPDIDKVLSLIEVSFWTIENVCPELSYQQKSKANITQEPDDAIEELNYRFKEHSIGYQYVSGKIIPVDSQYIHAEVVKPAISLLQRVGFEGASEEFLTAHKKYREGDNKGAIAEALKAFESTMKSICHQMNWEVPDNATAKPLIDVCFLNGLIPKALESHFTSLRNTLESGLPTTSNKLARHGQGKAKVTVPDYIASYALHLAATNIVFLVESYTTLKK